MTRRTRLLMVAGAVLVALLVVGGILAGTASHGHKGRPADVAAPPRPTTPTTWPRTSPSSLVSGWRPVAPATTVPADTPIQQQYDQGFEQGFSSAANRTQLAEIESLPLPAPALSGGWPALPPSYTPEGWTRQFVTGLLDIDFARQSRPGLGAWLVAQEAPDLMPGIPVGAQLASLYATVMDPAITGQASPIPSAAGWAADAAEDVRWTVSNLQVQIDPGWQSMITAGWQPIDLYASVEDVSGTLTSVTAKTTSRVTFSLQLQLGSAHWHPGYGTALVSGWKES